MYNFPNILKQLRIDKNLTLKQLSSKVNINATRLSRWEKGLSSPTSRYLVILAKYFNVKVDYLLGLNKI